jgi:Leucine-rich repeat (LRR) protein
MANGEASMLHQHPQQNRTAQSLDLDGQGLENLDDTCLQGNSLLKISLYNNRLRQFPRQILQHADLQVLNISCNQLSELPTEIAC